MIETLYKTDTPEKDKSECYVLVLAPRPGSDGRVYSFMEEHGRWDEVLGRFVYEVVQIIAEERMTQDAALAMYHTAKQMLRKKGFVHSFFGGCLRKEPLAHEVLEFEEMTA